MRPRGSERCATRSPGVTTCWIRPNRCSSAASRSSAVHAQAASGWRVGRSSWSPHWSTRPAPVGGRSGAALPDVETRRAGASWGKAVRGAAEDVSAWMRSACFSALVEQAEPEMIAGKAGSFRRLRAEQGNLRAALAWLISREEAEPALRVVNVLRGLLDVLRRVGGGRAWLDRALERALDASPALRSCALLQHVAMVAQFQVATRPLRPPPRRRWLALLRGGHVGHARASSA